MTSGGDGNRWLFFGSCALLLSVAGVLFFLPWDPPLAIAIGSVLFAAAFVLGKAGAFRSSVWSDFRPRLTAVLRVAVPLIAAATLATAVYNCTHPFPADRLPTSAQVEAFKMVVYFSYVAPVIWLAALLVAAVQVNRGR